MAQPVSNRGRAMRAAYLDGDPGGMCEHGRSDVPGAKGCYYCWQGDHSSCRRHRRSVTPAPRHQSPAPRRGSAARCRPVSPAASGRASRRSVGRQRSMTPTATGGIPRPSFLTHGSMPPTEAGHDAYLAEVEAMGPRWTASEGHTGWCTHPILKRTSYAKEAEQIMVTPFSQINVFPDHRSYSRALSAARRRPSVVTTPTRSRSRGRPARTATPVRSRSTGRSAAVSTNSERSSAAVSATWSIPSERPTLITGRSIDLSSTQRYEGPPPFVPNSSSHSMRQDQREAAAIVRELTSGRVQSVRELPMPALFVQSP